MLSRFRVGNKVVLGVINQPSSEYGTEAHIHRTIRLKDSSVPSGSIVDTGSNGLYILRLDRVIPRYVIYIGLKCNVSLTIKNKIETTHPVTGMKQYVTETEGKEHPACREEIDITDDKNFMVRVTRYSVAGNLHTQAKVNDKSIKNVVFNEGITQFEVA